MKIAVLRSAQEVYEAAADRLASQIRLKPDSLIGLATGRTTSGIHRALADLYLRKPFDVARVKLFGVDEITNMPRTCPASCYYLLYNDVLRPLGVPEDNLVMPDPMARDAQAECVRYEEALTQLGEVDLLELGIGENGHLGFNQPSSPFGNGVWHSWMDEKLHERLCLEYGLDAGAQYGGLTLGIRNMMQCKRIMLAATGESKAYILAWALFGPVSEDVPASVLQLHPDYEIIADEAAAQQLHNKMK
jgi:glucosamine-6-phosphate deaminase